MSSFQKALSTTAGSGGDMVIPQLADQIIPVIRQKSYLRQFLVSFNQPTETFRFPKLSTGNSVYYVAQSGTAPESLVSTGTVELIARKLMTALAISAELDEDSVLPVVPVIRDDMGKAFALAEENAFLRGNSAHLATETVEANATEINWFVNDVRLAYNGLLATATLTPYDQQDNPATLAMFSRMIRNLGVFGRDKAELLFLVSLKEEDRLRQLLGVNLSLNQIGLTGTALPGEIGRLWGVPVVATTLLDSANAATPTSTQALLINRNASVIGDRRVFTIKSSDEVLIRSDQLLVVGSERLSFAAQYVQAISIATNIGE